MLTCVYVWISEAPAMLEPDFFLNNGRTLILKRETRCGEFDRMFHGLFEDGRGRVQDHWFTCFVFFWSVRPLRFRSYVDLCMDERLPAEC